VIVEWLGHAAVRVTTAGGCRILFDPYEPGGFDGRIAHAPIEGPFDVVVLTHHHADHAFVTPALGTPRVVDRSCRFAGLAFRTVPAWHDAERGARMGLTRLIVLEADGRRLAHLGDLGVPPDARQVRRLGRPDLLLVPVGGTYTVAATGALETVARLHPAVVVPLHYRTERCSLPPDGAAPFLADARARGWTVRERPLRALEVAAAPPDDPPVVQVLEPLL
jgi:L-ascorbate metabolism protein UlaG (beta-lactamase superfamily)